MSQAEANPVARVRVDVTEPPLFRVVYINDTKTSVGFVIQSLVEHFSYTADTAETITMEIHEAGSAVVAVLPYEVAEQKGIEITVDARAEGYPLQIKLEPDAD